MPDLVKVVKNDSFIGPMTAGSGNPDFWWHQLLPQVMPVVWVPQSCPRMHRLGRNHCPMLADKKSFKLFNSSLTGHSVPALLDFEIFLGVQYFGPKKCSNHDLYTPQNPSNAPRGARNAFWGCRNHLHKIVIGV